MKQAKISLEYLPIGLRSTVVGAPHSQNLIDTKRGEIKGINTQAVWYNTLFIRGKYRIYTFVFYESVLDIYI